VPVAEVPVAEVATDAGVAGAAEAVTTVAHPLPVTASNSGPIAAIAAALCAAGLGLFGLRRRGTR
jgi:LPXTG-motif cell wall-anchored protein